MRDPIRANDVLSLLSLLTVATLLSGMLAAQEPQSIGHVVASDATVKGAVILVSGGTIIGSGSTISAGQSAAVLQLDRGGRVRVCPGTAATVTAEQRGSFV